MPPLSASKCGGVALKLFVRKVTFLSPPEEGFAVLLCDAHKFFLVPDDVATVVMVENKSLSAAIVDALVQTTKEQLGD